MFYSLRWIFFVGIVSGCIQANQRHAEINSPTLELPTLETAHRCIGANRAALSIARRLRDERASDYLHANSVWIRAAYFVRKSSEGARPEHTKTAEFHAFLADMNNHINAYVTAFQVEVRGELENKKPGTGMFVAMNECLREMPTFVRRNDHPDPTIRLANMFSPKTMFCVDDNGDARSCGD